MMAGLHPDILGSVVTIVDDHFQVWGFLLGAEHHKAIAPGILRPSAPAISAPETPIPPTAATVWGAVPLNFLKQQNTHKYKTNCQESSSAQRLDN